MKSSNPILRVVVGGCTACALAFLPLSTGAVTVTYNVVSGSSTLTMSGNAFGIAYAPQSPGALVDAWGGTITGDLTGGVLTLSGGSAITALLNPAAPFTTAPYPPAGGVDNYGPTGTGFVTGFGLVTINGAYRDLTLDITAGTVVNGAAPAGMTLQFTAGKLDWGAASAVPPYTPIAGGTSSLIGVNGANTDANLATLTPTMLVLPVTFHTTGSNRYEDWTGTIVAVIPEPAAAGLVGFGLLALATLRRRQGL